MVEPKPEPQQVEMLLRKTISAWFAARPEAVIERTQPVVEAGQTSGIQVWYGQNVAEHLPLPPLPAPADLPGLLTFEVSESVRQQLPKEHIEAVIEEAIQVWNDSHDRDGTLAVVNARRIVVIIDGRASRGAVVPVEALANSLDDRTMQGLLHWLRSPQTRLHVVQVAGGWFGRREDTGERRRVAEPGFVRTNMTYDAGGHPGA
jgi:hypothetical protein